MKLTKLQLKQLIKESVREVILENKNSTTNSAELTEVNFVEAYTGLDGSLHNYLYVMSTNDKLRYFVLLVTEEGDSTIKTYNYRVFAFNTKNASVIDALITNKRYITIFNLIRQEQPRIVTSGEIPGDISPDAAKERILKDQKFIKYVSENPVVIDYDDEFERLGPEIGGNPWAPRRKL